MDNWYSSRGPVVAGAAALILSWMLSAGPARAVTIDPGDSVQLNIPTKSKKSASSCGGLNTCAANPIRSRKLIEVITALSGIAQTKTAKGTLIDVIVVSGDSDRSIDGVVSGSVSWSGDLETVGVVGAKASITIQMEVVDQSTGLVAGGTTILSESCETFIVLDSCLKRPSGTAPVNFPVSLQRGRTYELRFSAECVSKAGLAGDANCIFNLNGAVPFAGGSVSRSILTVKLDEDLIGLIEEFQAQVFELKTENTLLPCRPVVGLFLPEASGGQAESVRELVATRIEQFDDAVDAPGRVRKALKRLEQGDKKFDNGRFQNAYRRYCSAYSAIARGSDGDDDDDDDDDRGGGGKGGGKGGGSDDDD